MPIDTWLTSPRRKGIAVVAAVCLLAALVGTAVYLCLPMPAGTYVDGVDVSGLPYWKAQAQIRTPKEQILRVSLPGEVLTVSSRDYGVKIDLGGALRAARKQGGDIQLRPYLKANEDALRSRLTELAARLDTQYREAEWHLEGEAPQLQTDRFDPSAPGQTLVVTLGSSEAHLNVEDGVEAILDAFSHPVRRNGDLIALTPEPEKVPPLPDAERLCAEVNIAPVNDSPDAATGGVKPGSYGQSVDSAALEKALAAADYGETVSLPLTYTPPELMGEDALFCDVLGEYETKHNTNENRNNNLRLLCTALDGYIVQPGETFSYNQVVGERTKERGYLPAPAYSGNRLTDSVGGGVCQGSTTLYNCVLLADLEVVFRACHGAKVTYVPDGLDATVNYLTTDFQFRNQYHFPVKIRAEVSDGYVKMKLLGVDEKDYYVKMETRSGEDELAVYARSYKCKYDKQTDELLSRDIEAYSTYYKNIG